MRYSRWAACSAAALLFAGLASANYNPADFDPTVKPQDDFYHYVNGTWLKKTPIPPAYTGWGAFYEVDEHNENALHQILERVENPANRHAEGPLTKIEQQVGDFYASGMDEAAVNAAGLSPLKPGLSALAGVQSPGDIQDAIAQLHSLGVSAGFVFESEQDPKNSATVIGGVGQGGLGLPERDYYLKTDPKSVTLREKYLAHVANILVLGGDQPGEARQEAAAIMRLETALANGSKSSVDLRDPVANYHLMKVSELPKVTPTFDWARYFQAVGLAAPASLDIGQPGFLTTFDGLLKSVSAADWRAYLRWHLLHSVAPYLSQAFVNENFDFYGRTLVGSKELHERWKRVERTVDGSIGENLGQLYVGETFSPEAKARMVALIGNLRSALREKLSTLSWMDEPTRQKALQKLDAFNVKVGYPDKWIDYGKLSIDRTSYAGNVLRSRQFNVARDLRKIGQPVDRSEWGLTPSTVNAYYDPAKNEIVFPAGILQPPLFDAKADEIANYGSIGTMIGHEMTHGFDDEGRQFDPRGNLADWWTPESAQRFKQRSAAIVKQFNGYAVEDNLHVNGELTQGENIADLGGLKIAYAAMHHALSQVPGAENRIVDGFTVDQRFFLSYATQWQEKDRAEAMRLQVTTDPHSPNEFRVNGPLSNLPEFFAAFHVPEGAPMRRSPADRVDIW